MRKKKKKYCQLRKLGRRKATWQDSRMFRAQFMHKNVLSRESACGRPKTLQLSGNKCSRGVIMIKLCDNKNVYQGCGESLRLVYDRAQFHHLMKFAEYRLNIALDQVESDALILRRIDESSHTYICMLHAIMSTYACVVFATEICYMRVWVSGRNINICLAATAAAACNITVNLCLSSLKMADSGQLLSRQHGMDINKRFIVPFKRCQIS